MAIAKDVIIIWPSTNASIPSNFTRETSLDGKYPKGTASATNPNVTGGATTHTHTSAAHSHTLVDHVHSFTLSTTGTYSDVQAGGSGGMVNDHNHTGNTSATSGGTTNTTAATYGAASNDPPYYEVIFIKASSSVPIPDGAIVFNPNSSVPTGFTFCDGGGGTPDLRNKYVKGATAGGNSGGTGGSTTNTHDLSHTHTTNTHTHTATSSTSANTERDMTGSSGDGMTNHSHTVTLDGATQTIDAYSSSLVTTETVEPLFKKLIPIKNTSGGNRMPTGIIGMWLGTLATIPAGWYLCDGQNGTPNMLDYYIKGANTTAEGSVTGGANTHTHAAQSHTHTTTTGHTHTGGTISAHVANRTPNGNSPAESPSNPNTAHSFDAIGTTLATYASATTTAGSSSNEPPYLTVAFIQYQFEASAGLLLALL